MKSALRWFGLCAMGFVALQLYFAARIALMGIIAPQSTAFERSEAWRITTEQGSLRWSQTWIAYDDMPQSIKRAVLASEDDGFASHNGVDWDALKQAWAKNAKAEQRAQAKASSTNTNTKPSSKPVKIVGGSTITQQLAKNLFLTGERTLLRKGQELLLTMELETFLSKQRILEIYLNSVEWGEGVFGIEAAAQHYFRKPASKLSTSEAARLAVMLPRPKYFEKVLGSGYLVNRAGVIAARMGDVQLP